MTERRGLSELRNDELVQLYIGLRDRRAKRKADFNNADAEDKERQAKIEALLMKKMAESGDEAVRTKAGTAYRTTRTTASMADWDAFLAYVKEHDAWELLTHSVSKDGVSQHLAANDELPPGVNWREEIVVNVRR